MYYIVRSKIDNFIITVYASTISELVKKYPRDKYQYLCHCDHTLCAYQHPSSAEVWIAQLNDGIKLSTKYFA